MAFITKNDEQSAGQRMLLYMDYLATGLFAVVGTIIAGQAGMNIVGTTFVGGVASMGGGSLNNILTGNTRGGVFWMKDWRFLTIALMSSVATFHLWPMYEESVATHYYAEIHGAIGQCSDERDWCGVQFEDFRAALDGNPGLARRIFGVCGPKFKAEFGQDILHEADGARYLFEWLAKGGDELGLATLQLIARWEAMDSPVLYALESVALGAISVIGAQNGIVRGVHPLACVSMRRSPYH